MYIVPESAIADLVSRKDSFDAVEQVFASMAKGSAYNFPVIREAIGHAEALYGFKSGFDRDGLNLGLKSGGYWPGNEARGLTNHQSTVFLFDADTGKCRAVVLSGTSSNNWTAEKAPLRGTRAGPAQLPGRVGRSRQAGSAGDTYQLSMTDSTGCPPGRPLGQVT